MKKRILALALVVVMLLSFTTISASAAAEMNIYRLATQPIMDGKLTAGEYYLLADSSFAYDLSEDNSEKDAEKAEKKVYAGYDDNYLYVATTITCETHMNEWVFVADGGENDYDIYDGHSAMFGITSVNPATDEDCIKTITDATWDWSKAYNSCIGREFTIAQTSDTEIQLSGVHFSHTKTYVPTSDIFKDELTGGAIQYNAANDADLPMDSNFFAVSHDKASKLDIYEIMIPWKWIDYKTDRVGNTGGTVIPFDRVDGTYCGLAIKLATGDIDGDVYVADGDATGLASAGFGTTQLTTFGKYIPLVLSSTADSSIGTSPAVGVGFTPGTPGGNKTEETAATEDKTAATEDETAATEDETAATEDETVTTEDDTAKDDTKTGDEKDDKNGIEPWQIALGVVCVLAIAAAIVLIIKKKKGSKVDAAVNAGEAKADEKKDDK